MWKFNELDKTACIQDNGARITYRELIDEASYLNRAVGERCLVFSFCQNSIGSMIGYVSFLNSGIVPLMLNNAVDSDLTWDLVNKYKPKYLWIPEKLRGHFEQFEVVYSTYEYNLVRTHFEELFQLNDDLALLLTTSGSTGSPKFVRQSYKNIQANTRSIIEYLGVTPEDKPITTLPMSYTYGLSIINTHLQQQATLLLTDCSMMEKSFWTFLKEEKATSFGGVPYTYEMLEKLRIFRMELPYLKTMTQAGGKLSPELHKKYAEFAEKTGKKFIVMYGQTEATARMSYLPVEKSVEKYGSIGVAIPGGKFSLIDTEGQLIERADSVGELVYEGKNVTLGYALSGNDLILGDENKGRLITGDMAKKDEDGYYYVVGRKKRFLKLFGIRVNLDELEHMIKDKFSTECACAGEDDHLKIYLTDSQYSEVVQQFVIHKLGITHFAFKIMQINEIPKNESGKIQYSKLDE